jgi:hypothetical protein
MKYLEVIIPWNVGSWSNIIDNIKRMEDDSDDVMLGYLAKRIKVGYSHCVLPRRVKKNNTIPQMISQGD